MISVAGTETARHEGTASLFNKAGNRATRGTGTETARHEGTARLYPLLSVPLLFPPGTETARHEGTARTTSSSRCRTACTPARRLPAMRALQVGMARVEKWCRDARHGDCPP